MTNYHKPRKKKVSRGTGGKRRGKQRDKKLAHMGRDFTSTRVSEKDQKSKVRSRGGNSKLKLNKVQKINLPSGGRATIKSVLSSHNPEYVRRNIITKNAILDTDKGKVRVTNRVGQDGVLNGVLVKDKESA